MKPNEFQNIFENGHAGPARFFHDVNLFLSLFFFFFSTMQKLF